MILLYHCTGSALTEASNVNVCNEHKKLVPDPVFFIKEKTLFEDAIPSIWRKDWMDRSKDGDSSSRSREGSFYCRN